MFPYSHISEATEIVGTTARNQAEGKRPKDVEVGVGRKKRGGMRGGKEKPQAEMEQETPRGDSNISLLLKITLHKKSCSFKAQRLTEKWLSYLGLLNV